MAWKKAYEKRVGDIMDTLLRGGVRRVYWVGAIMGEGWRNSRMRLIDGLAEEADERPGTEYIDIWDLFTNPDGSFDPSLRLDDRVHFTAEGQPKLAEAVDQAIKTDWPPPGWNPEAPSASPSASPSAP